jgi:undecaprenyl-phosphate 4-deoxy-4-formamido-L-arabinose transferase
MNCTDLISIVVPVYNEQENLEELIGRCTESCNGMERPFELILVDDGSRDSSPDIIAEAAEQSGGNVIGVLLNRNYGQHAAVMAGFAESGGGIVVTFFRRIASYMVNKVAQKATGIIMHDYGCMLRAYRRHIVDAMLACDERSTFIPVLANSFARHATEIEVQHDKRSNGHSKYSLWKLINLQFDLLTSMTTFPLRLLSVIGTVISLIGTGFGVFLIVMRLIYGATWAAEGVFTLFAILFIFVGAQFIGMGLLGEYLGRIYYDVRGRPRYFVRRVIGSNNKNKEHIHTEYSVKVTA